MPPTKQFDPVSYIESAFMENGQVKTAKRNRKSKKAVAEGSDIKFRKTSLRAPRPRRAKNTVTESLLDDRLRAYLADLPEQIEFLGAFFDDSVTANYYTGDFKESRSELIYRLLDPELSLEEVSRLLGVCPATVRRYTNRNWLTHHRTKGGQRRFRLSGVIAFVDEHGRHPED